MKAVLYYGPQDIRYENTMIKPLNKGEILVKVEAALTCGTDVKTFRRGHPVLIKNIPSGFGHEFSGIVEKISEGVENVKVGDRVVCANSAPCGECFYCKREEYNLCENLDLLNGAYAEYIVIPERIVKKNTLLIPNNLSFEKAAFSAPLGVVTEPVKSQFGYHLILVTDKTDSKIPDFEEIKEGLTEHFRQSKITYEMGRVAEELRKNFDVKIDEEVLEKKRKDYIEAEKDI